MASRKTALCPGGDVCDHAAVSSAPPEQRSGAQSVERALAVLRCFEVADGDLGVTDIATRAGLSVSTAHRLVRALCGGGLLSQDPRTERYQLGPTLVVLGRRAEEHLGYARAMPALEGLARSTGESVNLGIRSGSDVLVVLAVSSPQPLRFDQELGTRVPLHASAMGKCLLAFADDRRRALAGLSRLARFTERTIVDTPALGAELDRTRARGWSVNDGERDLGVRAVAAPVLAGTGANGAAGSARSAGGGPGGGTAVAAVAVQGPAVRLPSERLAALGAEVTGVADAIAPLLAAPGA
jgi:DNA-binding IclR family transcriptional regulator